jgi:endonuclease-3 related protein
MRRARATSRGHSVGQDGAKPDLARQLSRAYDLMRRHYGHQHWWPGETPFEVCVGAILTQNTSWANVERAIARLKAARVLDPAALYALPEPQLAELIRPAGYYNVKARRLRSFLKAMAGDFAGDLPRFFKGKTSRVRDRLLAIKGIGPETADSMLLYAGSHTSFVVDAYTRRILHRHGWAPASASYRELQALCAAALNEKMGAERLDYWQDYHAQLVNVAKDFCRARQAQCERCPLRQLLPQ